MKILILGAAGQIGRMLAKDLIEQTENDLVLYARNASNRLKDLASERVSLANGDFSDYAHLVDAMKGVDAIYLNDMNDKKGVETIVKAMKAVGVEQWYIDSCYKIKYMFPKAHAAAYVIAALRLAWYKIHKPINFYSAYFTVRGGAIDAVAAVAGKQAVKKKMEEIKLKGNDKTAKDESTYIVLQIVIEMLARGIEFLPVDIYKSDARIYQIEDGKIRLPFGAVDGIGENAAVALANARNDGGGEFLSYDDLMARAGVGKSVCEALKNAGALGDMPESNQISLF